MSEQTVEFVPLNGFDDYEILNQYPFTIRRKDNHYEVKEHNDKGYPRIMLNNKHYFKHRLIALQFIPNNDPINKYEIDHINRDKTDFHLENLRWINQSENCKNKSSHKGIEYEYFDEISEDSIIVDKYNQHTRASIGNMIF